MMPEESAGSGEGRSKQNKALCAYDKHQFFKGKTSAGLEGTVVQNQTYTFQYAHPELEIARLVC